MSRPIRPAAVIALLLALPAARAEVTVITAVADTSLFEWLDDYNFGAQSDLPAGGLGPQAGALRLCRALFKFDVAAAVPADATITGAEMRLHLHQAPDPEQRPVESDFALYRVLVDWGEGDNFNTGKPGGDTADEGESSWLHRFSPGVAWSAPGGQFGVDYSDTWSAMVPVPAVDSEGDYVFEFNAIGVADVQSALDDPAGNHGWMLRSESEDTWLTARRWSSREAPTAGDRPQLEITWELPGPGPRITSIEADPVAGEVRVRVDGVSGISYRVSTSEDLVTWVPGEVQTPASDGELLFELPYVDPAQYVRIEATPSS